jgi:hypothetical protein
MRIGLHGKLKGFFQNLLALIFLVKGWQSPFYDNL